MFERFTERARAAMGRSREQAIARSSEFIGDEHLLAGLLADGQGLGGRVLLKAGVTLDRFWQAVDRILTESSSGSSLGQHPLTESAKRAIVLAGEATSSLGNDVISTEHLLLGLLKDPDCTSSRALLHLNLARETLRDAVLKGIAAGEGDPHFPPIQPR